MILYKLEDIIKPFIDIDVGIKTSPIEVNTELTCKYGELLQVGYEYDYVFYPQYGVIKTDTTYTLLTVNTWTKWNMFSVFLYPPPICLSTIVLPLLN